MLACSKLTVMNKIFILAFLVFLYFTSISQTIITPIDCQNLPGWGSSIVIIIFQFKAVNKMITLLRIVNDGSPP